jgi:uncharacterized repeat protein (TIGR03803 family)
VRCFGGVYHGFTAPINGINQDGANPAAGLAAFGGLLYGTTLNGGSQGAGTAFYLASDAGSFNAFRSFTNAPDAGNPQGELAVSGNQFYGTSLGGGTSGTGTLFAGQTNANVAILKSFGAVQADTATNSGGASPSALLALSAGAFYGTATAGGAFANGAVFSASTNGSSFSILHHFSVLDSVTGTNADGAAPWGGLILSGNTLYGTACAGGGGSSGVVFSLNTNASGFTVLHSFAPLDSLTATNPDGALPLGGLVVSSNILYGTTAAGGQSGRGTVFCLQTNGVGFTVLHHFQPVDPVAGTNSDGAAPCAPLTLGGNTLYGSAPAGGSAGNGTVYCIKTDGTQFKTLYSFSAMSVTNGTNSDGALPVAGLLLLGNSLYGTTFSGGPGAVGTVFSLPIPLPPANITNIVLNPGGGVELFFLGAPNSTNIVQAAPSLSPPVPWQIFSTNVADAAGAWQFTDSSTNFNRFYRSYAR